MDDERGDAAEAAPAAGVHNGEPGSGEAGPDQADSTPDDTGGTAETAGVEDSVGEHFGPGGGGREPGGGDDGGDGAGSPGDRAVADEDRGGGNEGTDEYRRAVLDPAVWWPKSVSGMLGEEWANRDDLGAQMVHDLEERWRSPGAQVTSPDIPVYPTAAEVATIPPRGKHAR